MFCMKNYENFTDYIYMNFFISFFTENATNNHCVWNWHQIYYVIHWESNLVEQKRNDR